MRTPSCRRTGVPCCSRQVGESGEAEVLLSCMLLGALTHRLPVVWCVACCMLPSAGCMLHAAFCLLHAACCMLPVVCCLLHAACCMLHAA